MSSDLRAGLIPVAEVDLVKKSIENHAIFVDEFDYTFVRQWGSTVDRHKNPVKKTPKLILKDGRSSFGRLRDSPENRRFGGVKTLGDFPKERLLQVTATHRPILKTSPPTITPWAR
jgi:hypothetical protein